MNPNAPKIDIVKIDKEKIGDLIGPGGKNIRAIIEACENQVEIDIQEDGTVVVMAVNKAMRDKALQMIDDSVGEAEIGAEYEGTVDRIEDYGMFVKVTSNISGLVHVSELSNEFVKDVNSLYKLGDRVTIKVIGKDNMGRLKFSVKQAKGNSQKSGDDEQKSKITKSSAEE